jgi:hypothetical protein
VTAKDKGKPNVRSSLTTATLTVTVERNTKSPIFFSNVYYKTIDSTQAISTSFMQVKAEDKDTLVRTKLSPHLTKDLFVIELY